MDAWGVARGRSPGVRSSPIDWFDITQVTLDQRRFSPNHPVIAQTASDLNKTRHKTNFTLTFSLDSGVLMRISGMTHRLEGGSASDRHPDGPRPHRGLGSPRHGVAASRGPYGSNQRRRIERPTSATTRRSRLIYDGKRKWRPGHYAAVAAAPDDLRNSWHRIAQYNGTDYARPRPPGAAAGRADSSPLLFGQPSKASPDERTPTVPLPRSSGVVPKRACSSSGYSGPAKSSPSGIRLPDVRDFSFRFACRRPAVSILCGCEQWIRGANERL